MRNNMSSNEQPKIHNGPSSSSSSSAAAAAAAASSSSSRAQASKSNNLSMHSSHSCEICGESGLSDEKMLEHTQKSHIDNQIQCPFCGLTGSSSAELMLHVNQAHLDYLTPENELMSFIDDSKTPSGDESDSMSCGMLSPSTFVGGIENNINGGSHLSNGVSCKAIAKDQAAEASSSSSSMSTNNHRKILANINNSLVNKSESESDLILNDNHAMDDNNNNNNNNSENNNCDIVNGVSGNINSEIEVVENHGEGSPLRSQLGLKLKANKPKITLPSIPSPLVCLMCPYTTNDPNILEEHINRSHFDPVSPGVNNSSASASNGAQASSTNNLNTTETFSCPICVRCFDNDLHALELHVNHEHSDILSPAKIDSTSFATGGNVNGKATLAVKEQDEAACSPTCPVCGVPFPSEMKTQEMELHIEAHFAKSPTKSQTVSPDLEKEARRAQEQREFEMLRAQYGMDDQGNFREQSMQSMQRAVYAGEMSVADYYCRQVGLRAAEQTGVDDCSSCTKSVVPRVVNLSASSPGIIKSYVCSNVDHYAASYGDRGWGCGYRNAQMIISSIYQNPMYNELLKTAIGSSSMPSISKLQKMIESAWKEGFDEQGKEQLGCKLYETRKWIGATEIVTLFSWMRIECQLVDFHRPTAPNGCHPELFNYVLRYFEQPKPHTPPLYLQHQGHSRTIIGIEQKTSGLALLILDPSHSPKQVASLGTSQDSLRLLRRGPSAMKAPQYQIVSVVGKILTEEDYQASKIIRSLRIPPDR